MKQEVRKGEVSKLEKRRQEEWKGMRGEEKTRGEEKKQDDRRRPKRNPKDW